MLDGKPLKLNTFTLNLLDGYDKHISLKRFFLSGARAEEHLLIKEALLENLPGLVAPYT